MASGCPVAAFPVNGPLDVVGNSGAGVLDWNLKTAAMAALKIERKVPLEHARSFTWKNCAEQFQGYLAPIGISASVPKQVQAIHKPISNRP